MVYILCILAVLFFSFVAEKNEKRIGLFFVALILSVFCGMRSEQTGIDTSHYYKYMSYIRELGIFYGSDIGFSVVTYFFMGIFENPCYPLFIYATISNFFIVYRLWDFRKECSLPLMFFIYMTFYYPYSFNIVRQFLAISIIFWATRFIERNQTIKYAIANIIASTMHSSALMCFSFLFITFGTKTKNKLYKVLGFFLAIVFVIVGMNLFSTNISKYGGHFAIIESRIHAMTIVKFLCLGMIVLLNWGFRNVNFSFSKFREKIPMQSHIPKLYVTGLSLSALGMFFPFMNRVGFYFLMFEMPFWGQVSRAIIDGKVYKTIILLITIYVLVVHIMSGENINNLFYYHSFLFYENK